MKRKVYTIVCLVGLLLIGGAAQADPVGREQARTVAANFVRAANLNIDINPTKGAADLMSEQFSNFYVFTGSNGRGFVIVSADDCAAPILGYSEDAPFTFDSMPDHVREWLQGYENEIAYYRSQTLRAGSTMSEQWRELLEMDPLPGMGTAKTGNSTTVSPLLQTQWNQTPLYNAHCPQHPARRYCYITENDTDTLTGSFRTVTGCVATATAQVMKYWNWPPHGRGSNQYSKNYYVLLVYDTVIDGTTYTGTRNTNRRYQETLSATFADTTFDWEAMPNDLTSSSSSSEVDAVATLMYNVGIALNMEYGPESAAVTLSGNTLGNHTVEEALRNYFYYSHTVASVQQQDFSNDEWKAMLRHELDAARPIVYKGSSSSGGGHCFLCDGYDNEDRFHFNWGWGGYCDGYYAIGSLNPAPGGVGGNSESSYNLNGGAVIGIEPAYTMQPETGTTTIIASANNAAYGTVSGSGTYNNWTETVTLTATPAEGYSFVEWSDGNRYNPRRLIASGGCQTFTAVFKPWSSGNVSYCGSFPSRISYYTESNVPEWGIRIPYSMLRDDLVLDKVSFMGYAGSYTIKVYRGGSTPADGQLVYTSSSYNVGTSLRTINQTTNIAVTANEDLWVTLSGSGKRCIPYTDMTSSDGHWDKSSSGVWTNLSSIYYPPYLIACHFTGTEYSMVEGLTVTSVNGTGATISWTAPTDMTPSGYTLAYGTGYQPEQMHSVATTATTYSLTGLENNTEYRVFVKATYGSDLRCSDWAGATFTTTTVSNPVNITGYANDPAMGFVAGCGIYESGSSVTLQAIPMVGCVFVGWDDGYGTNPTRTVTANADAEYSTTFGRQGYAFTANSNDETLGTVEVDGEASYATGGTTYYPFLSTVTLTAIPNGSATFSHWSDGNTTNPRFCTVMESNPTYTAYFESAAKGSVTYTNQGLQLWVNTTDLAPVRVYDMLGRQLYACDPTTNTTITFTLPAAGVYIIRVGDYNEKIIIR